MNERVRRTVRRYLELVVADAIVVVVALWLSWSIRAVTAPLEIKPLFLFTALSVLIYWLSNFLFRLYHRIWKYASSADIFPIVNSTVFGTGIVAALCLIWPERRPLPLSVVLVTGFFAFSGFLAVRYRKRIWTGIQWRLHAIRGKRTDVHERVLIVGAGEAGEIFARRFLTKRDGIKYHLIGFVDDDPSKHEMWLHDLPIFGDHSRIPEIVSKYRIDLIVIAIFNITGENFRAILDACEKTSAKIKVIPDLMDFVRDRPGVPTIRDISSEDLLGRKAVEIDETACRQLLEGRRILVTGAAGSIGSELCRQILIYNPSQLLMLDNNESGLYELGNQIRRPVEAAGTEKGAISSEISNVDRLLTIVGSVTNRSKLNFLFDKYHPEIVFHAAAYKHVPMMEEQPDEALWVNVWGAKNLVELSKEYGVERFVLVSTDKAVQPVCIMGATKWLGELMMMHPDAWARRKRSPEETERRKRPRSSRDQKRLDVTEDWSSYEKPGTLFTAVRFGNVLASRGSVVPTFEKQIKSGGPVMVTHPDMTRYFMSITEAVRLIIQAATFTNGQDVFMLNMGERIKIDDLARRLIRLRGARPGIDIPIVYSGIRPGEKLHEELLGPNEDRLPTKHSCIFRIQKNHAPDPESLANEIDQLLLLAKDHSNNDLAERLQAFVAKEEGQQPDGQIISFKGKISELIPAAKEAEASGQWDRALDLYEEAVKLSEGLQTRRADLLCWMGNAYFHKGDFARAKELLQDSHETSRKNGHISGMISASAALGNLALDSNNYNLALRHYKAAYKYSTVYNHDDQKADILFQVGVTFERSGKLGKAISAFKHALEAQNMKSDASSSSRIQFELGSCCLKLGRLESAASYFSQCLQLFQSLQDGPMIARIYLKTARLNLERSDLQHAREHVEEAVEILLNLNLGKELAESYLILGMILRRERKSGLAEENLQKALNLGSKSGSLMILGDVYVELALWSVDQNQVENGLKFLSKAVSEYSKISTNGELKEVKEKAPNLEHLFLKVARDYGDRHDRIHPHSANHCWRVALYCLELSEWMGLPSDQKKALITAAFLHDVGEKKISPEILAKQGSLTTEERQQVREHVMHSARMIEEIRFPWPEVLAYVKYHHERYNGEGYPLGLRGEEIHLGARILAIADYFVALTADRPHRKAISFHDALEQVREESGKMFDPKVVEVFLNQAFVERLLFLSNNEKQYSDFDRFWNRIQQPSTQKDGLVYKFENQPSINNLPKQTKTGG